MQARSGKLSQLSCPYCSAKMKPSGGDPEKWIRPNVSPWCCENMDAAMKAVQHRYILQPMIDAKRMIEEQAQAAAQAQESKLIH